MKIPIVNFESYDESKPDTIQALARDVEQALTKTGFMSVANLACSAALVDKVFRLSEQFFTLPLEQKNALAYADANTNFGYQGVCEESLEPNMPPDLKEALTVRNLPIHNNANWPSEEFRDVLFEFYEACIESARRMQVVFSVVLKTPVDFFINRHTGENITLRLLHYPSVLTKEIQQLGAGAHTDYGTMTLLFQDMIGGLEVQDDKGEWLSVEPVPNTIVFNTGDLMACWTNNYFRSTRHRVQPRINGSDRYSIALFLDPDSEVIVECLESCVSEDKPAITEPMTAGQHIQKKIAATQVLRQGNKP